MSALNLLKTRLVEGKLYRRHDLLGWSNAVDRHLNQLVKKKILTKLSGGLYYYPKKTIFGAAPPTDSSLIFSFLKDKNFLVFSYNSYNTLGLGITQLYNETIVYNYKRHGEFKLGNRNFNFIRKSNFPLKINPEFLLVDLVNNINKLAENKEILLKKVLKKAKNMDLKKLSSAVLKYGNVRSIKFFSKELNIGDSIYEN